MLIDATRFFSLPLKVELSCSFGLSKMTAVVTYRLVPSPTIIVDYVNLDIYTLLLSKVVRMW